MSEGKNEEEHLKIIIHMLAVGIARYKSGQRVVMPQKGVDLMKNVSINDTIDNNYEVYDA